MIVRFLLLNAICIWQGGFVFYALAVVPVGSELFSPTEQGFVTQRVTVTLNILGLLTLTLAVLELLRGRMADRRFQLRVGLWALNLATLAALHLLHGQLDRRMNPETFGIGDAGEFYALHRWYLILSGEQWLLMLAYLWLTLAAWRRRDAQQ